MRLFFIIPLIVALIGTYAYQKSDDELSYLTGAVTVISLTLSLILAPWELQAGILVLAIFLAKQFWGKIENQREEESPDPKNNNSNLVTDSASLTANNPQEKTSQEKTAKKYRGAAWGKTNFNQTSGNQKRDKLKYRGISFTESESDSSSEK